MPRGNSDAEWERYGQTDPYFGVCSHEQFRRANLDDDARQEFFASGEAQVELFFALVRKHLGEDFAPERALDFGCGVGRVTIPLAKRCANVVGVDVSDAMLAEARENCRRYKLTNVELVKSDDQLTNVSGSFDFIHSFIVFQHIPTRRGEAILRAMIDRLKDGGVASLHFTYSRKASTLRKAVNEMRKAVPLVNGLVNVIQGKPFSYPMMQMNNYNLNRLFFILQENGCLHSYLFFTDHGGHQGVVLFFQKKGPQVQCAFPQSP